MDPEIHARSLGLEAIGQQIQSQIQAIPGQVQPAISHLASIGDAIAGAINSIAARAGAAAASISSAGATSGVGSHLRTASLNMDGKRVGQAVFNHAVAEMEIPSDTARFNGSYAFSPSDYAYT